ncbi:MAG: CIA30 family protein, partial [Muriicola sp.]|nr:CIA30 family protein [Muriicola sp.]
MIQTTLTIFNFTSNSNIDQWQVVNDGVMGGRSQGNFTINEEGHGLFQG